MAVLPITHMQWQVLRTVKRGRKPPTGRELRLTPTRLTKDGSFLTRLVQLGLLSRVTGTEAEPFEATYGLTDLGGHAAEYGEADLPYPPVEDPVPQAPKPRGRGT